MHVQHMHTQNTHEIPYFLHTYLSGITHSTIEPTAHTDLMLSVYIYMVTVAATLEAVISLRLKVDPSSLAMFCEIYVNGISRAYLFQ